MLRSLALAVLVTVAPAAALAAGNAKPARADGASMKRELRRRSLSINDRNVSSLPEIHVAGGIATILSFQVPLRDGGAFIADVNGLMNPLSQSERFVVLVPKKDLRAPLPLNVSLADGTVLTFKLLTVATDADAQVDVVLDLQKHAAPDSAAALKASLISVRAQLDECQAGSATAGVAKIASLFIQQNLDAPHAFERHAVRGGDKQSRLLVEARWAYRLLGMTYLVLTVENRDPSKSWVLDRAEVKLRGSSSVDVKVLSIQAELAALPPDVAEKLVVAFATPPQTARQKVSLSLFERDGSRHVVLEGLEL
ncbi:MULTISPECIES: DUF2381 family protein [Anaeromyxobacter]|uniref:DUF2381 family protein n=1 Tax=Anaeromyxobacter TaxID=161492 RepID=UPI001F55E472|nr:MULTISPECIES: DUF2381 family protein [unclassified Anaeromyxobacter]